MLNEDVRWMKRALKEALKGWGTTSPNPLVGAVIVKKGSMLGAGYHVKAGQPHAEVNAIRQACRKLGTFDLSGCEIYASCEPCPMCLASIYWARIDKLYYANTKSDADKIGFSDNFIYEEFAKPESQRSIKVVPMLRDEALAAFKKWEAKTDKTEY